MRLAFAVLTLLTVAAVWPVGTAYVREWGVVDSCLDSGGSFDYDRTVCDRAQNHPFVPFASRQSALLSATSRRLTGIAALGVVFAFGQQLRRRPSRPGLDTSSRNRNQQAGRLP